MTDIRTRVLGGDTLFGAFCDLASPLAAELAGQAGYDWLDPRSRARGGDRGGPARTPLRGRDDPGAPRSSGPSPPSGCGSDAPSTSGREGSCCPSSSRPTTSAPPSPFLRYPPAGVRGVALRTRGADMGALAPRRRGPGRQRAHRRHRPGRGAGHRAPMPTRSPPSTASTSCSSVRPTCRTRSASPAASTTRPTSTPCAPSSAACERHGKAAGILLYDAAVLARHLELGFRFIGLGSEGAFVSAGAAAMLRAAGRA